MTWLTNPYRFGGGGGGPGGTHRYWEIVAVAGINGTTAMSELALRATPGGANLITSGAMITGRTYGLAAAPTNTANLVDGNAGTYSSQGDAVIYGVAWRIDLGAPTFVAELAITASGLSSPPNRTIDTFFLRGSDDLITWRTYLVVIRASWSSTTQTKAWPLLPAFPTNGRTNAIAWRILGTSVNGGGSVNIAEMQWAASSAGPMLNALASSAPDAATPLTGTPFDSGILNGYTFAGEGPNRASDGTLTTRYAGRNPSGYHLGFLWPAAQDISELRLGPEGAAPQCAPKNFVIQYSPDLTNWITVASPAAQTGWVAGVLRTFNW